MGFVGRVREALSGMHSARCRIKHREGWTRFARPAGSLFAARSGCPTGCRQLLNPQSRVLIPPFRENINKKSPYFRTSSHLKYGGEGGMDSLRSPYGQPVRYALRLSNWLRQLSNPQSRVLIPPFRENINEKSPYFRTSSHLEYGGEGGIRTLDTLPYTHFPGVLLQPLGHLTILLSRCCWDGR